MFACPAALSSFLCTPPPPHTHTQEPTPTHSPVIPANYLFLLFLSFQILYLFLLWNLQNLGMQCQEFPLSRAAGKGNLTASLLLSTPDGPSELLSCRLCRNRRAKSGKGEAPVASSSASPALPRREPPSGGAPHTGRAHLNLGRPQWRGRQDAVIRLHYGGRRLPGHCPLCRVLLGAPKETLSRTSSTHKAAHRPSQWGGGPSSWPGASCRGCPP